MVDTNTLIQIGQRRRSSEYFQETAVLPEEVIREATAFPDIATLRNSVYPTTSKVLEYLVRVMSTIPTEDTTLVDLYQNKGGADPLLIACALDGQSKDSAYLVASDWIVVTADDAVRRKAEEFGLRSMNNADFGAIIDASLFTNASDGFINAHIEPSLNAVEKTWQSTGQSSLFESTNPAKLPQ